MDEQDGQDWSAKDRRTGTKEPRLKTEGENRQLLPLESGKTPLTLLAFEVDKTACIWNTSSSWPALRWR